MKISLFAYFSDLVEKVGIREAAELISKCGYTGAEFLFIEGRVPSEEEIGNEYRLALEEKGITLPCISCYAEIVKNSSPDKPDRNAIESLMRCADLAHALGAKYMHHTIYPHIDKNLALPYDTVIDAALAGCVEVAEYAKSVGVTVLYEPQGLVFNGKVGFVSFYREMKMRTDNVAVCFDVGNSFWVGEDPMPILDEVKCDVVHVHLKDYAGYADIPCGDMDCPREVSLGDGAVDMKKIVNTLRSVGYDGFFSVEDATDIPIEEKYNRTLKIID